MREKVLVLLLFISLASLSFSTSLLFADSASDAAQFHRQGIEQVKLYNFEEANLYFDKALQIEPDNVLYLYNKGVAILGQEKFYEAFIIFDKVLKIEPDHPIAPAPYQLAKSKMFKRVDGILDITIRDSNGYLVGYFRTSNVGILDADFVKKQLDQLMEKEYSRIDFDVQSTTKFDTSVTQTSFAPEGFEIPMVVSKHLSYPVKKGEVVSVHYTIFMMTE